MKFISKSKFFNRYLPMLLSVLLIVVAAFYYQIYIKPQSASASCGSGYSFCRQVTVDHTQAGSSDSSNFTVLASTTLASLKTVANGGDVNNTVSFNGQTVPADLVFSTTADCSTLMSWDFEDYVATTGEIEAWVLLTTLSHTSDTTFYMCYGKSSVSTYQGGAVGAAWNSNYKGVWHLPNGTTVSANDSTSNGNNGTINLVNPVTGQIDGGVNFVSASLSYISTPSISALSGASAFTLQMWFKRTTGFGGFLGEGSTAAARSILQIYNDGNIYFSMGTSIWGNFAQTDTTAWHHIVVVYDGTQASNSTRLKVYYDGSAQTLSFTGTIPATSPVTTSTLYMGRDENNLTYADGSTDENRISNIALSADWITAEYNNQKSGSTMVAFAAEQSGGGGGSPAKTGNFIQQGGKFRLKGGKIIIR